MIFVIALAVIAGMFAASIIKTDTYNKTPHRLSLSGEELFGTASFKTKTVSVSAAPRSSTWTKAFDLNNEGITEHNYQAFRMAFNSRLIELGFSASDRALILGHEVQTNEAHYSLTDKRRLVVIKDRLTCKEEP